MDLISGMRVFVSIADNGSLAKAGRELDLSPSVVSKNISALEVNGTFDDCQEMVKKSFLDKDIIKKNKLTSANSINIGRWLPQMFYYFFAYKYLKKINKPIVISVPSGNFGNICAGLLSKKMGLPIDHFIASTNINDVVPRYLKTNKYCPEPSIQTISNAMDVGNPSNFDRINKLFNQNLYRLKNSLLVPITLKPLWLSPREIGTDHATSFLSITSS